MKDDKPNELITCDICGKQFSKQGIGAHKWRMHGDGQNWTPIKPGTKTSWAKGLTKETDDRVRKVSEKLKKYNTPFYTSIDDDGKLYRKFMNKHVNARKESIECDLTYHDYCQLVHDANLVSSQLGFKGEGYVLARYGDIGPYTYENCRFIKQKQNSDEKLEHIDFNHIYCINDDLYFESASKAASHYNIKTTTLNAAIRKKCGYIEHIDKLFINIHDLTPNDPNFNTQIEKLKSKQIADNQNRLAEIKQRKELQYKEQNKLGSDRRPDKSTLLQQISTMPTTHVAKIYGVSDNCIKKWAKKYDIWESRLLKHK